MMGASIGGKGPYRAALVVPGNNRVHNCAGTNAMVTSIVSMITKQITIVVRRFSCSVSVVVECSIYTSIKGNWFSCYPTMIAISF